MTLTHDHYGVLSPEKKAKIVRLYTKDLLSKAVLAERFGVGAWVIKKALRGVKRGG